MSTSLAHILASDAKQKVGLVISKVISKGVYGDVDAGDVVAFRPEENTGDNVNKVKIRKGTLVSSPDLILWLDADIVLTGFTTSVGVSRYDVIYVDATCDTGAPALRIAENTSSAPAAPANHTYIPLWRIKRPADQAEITYVDCIHDPGAGDDPGKDMREKPSLTPHNHQLLAGATDVSATAAEINQVADGVRPAATASRLSDLAESNPTKTQLNELVGGLSTILHSHNSTNAIATPSGTASPLAGLLQLALTSSGVASSISATGNTITFNIVGDNLGNHTATTILNMVDHKITNVTNPTDNQDAATKSYVDSKIGTDLSGYARYTATANFNLSDTYKIGGLANGTVSGDAINLGQLNARISSLLTELGLDDRYKVGLQGDPNIKLNQKAWGNFNLDTYKIVNSGTIDKVLDTPTTLVTKRYVDVEIQEAVDDILSQIHGFFTNPATENLNMNNYRVISMNEPLNSQDAVTKNYVDNRIAYVLSQIIVPGAPVLDNLGNHIAEMNLNMNGYTIGNLVMSHQDENELTPKDMEAVNRRYLFDALTGAIEDIPKEELPDFTRFAKLGEVFEDDKNVLPMHFSVPDGGEINIRGTDGKQLLVIRQNTGVLGGADSNPEEVFINARIQGVEDPIDNQDAATKKYVDSKLALPAASDITVGYIIYNREPESMTDPAKAGRFVDNVISVLPAGFTCTTNGIGTYGPVLKIACSRSDYKSKWFFSSSIQAGYGYGVSVMNQAATAVGQAPAAAVTVNNILLQTARTQTELKNINTQVVFPTFQPDKKKYIVAGSQGPYGFFYNAPAYLDWNPARVDNSLDISLVGFTGAMVRYSGGFSSYDYGVNVLDYFTVKALSPWAFIVDIKMVNY